ncbi:hypothetical protein LZ30DRAFT_293934 [Colletotrichum cereale]|nr:hypothetical protein LZ30DRAFT_293934 [Colletotrichum cereale]
MPSSTRSHPRRARRTSSRFNGVNFPSPRRAGRVTLNRGNNETIGINKIIIDLTGDVPSTTVNNNLSSRDNAVSHTSAAIFIDLTVENAVPLDRGSGLGKCAAACASVVSTTHPTPSQPRDSSIRAPWPCRICKTDIPRSKPLFLSVACVTVARSCISNALVTTSSEIKNLYLTTATNAQFV